MTFRVAARFEIGAIIACLLVIVAACLPGPLDARQRALVIAVFGGFAIVFALLMRRHRSRLVVGDALRYQNRGRVVVVPLTAARAVVIDRPNIGISRPTQSKVRVKTAAGVTHLYVERHWLFGRAHLIRAHALAARLEVPLLDPTGDHDRRSRWRLRRWRAAGDEWKIVLAALTTLAMATLPIWFS